ncbi:uncharacterized protein LOC115384487 [Salarias fasciatus]|uniref:uncharacterized protein LOC115384487 n=1 Tax=Salarias fasciatus TaxID=181472 RepID=UPI001176D988|nr:uncharacterized protein LOC115384487 [Salarias fasciatus]
MADSRIQEERGHLDAKWQQIDSVFKNVMKLVLDVRQRMLQPLEDRIRELGGGGESVVRNPQGETDTLENAMGELNLNQVSSATSLDESEDNEETSIHTSNATLSMINEIQQELRKLTSLDTKASLPSIIAGNVRSICNKMDDLRQLTLKHPECSLMLFSEMWLNANKEAELEGFELIRADRTLDSGKEKAGGVAAYVNNQWCHPKKITVNEKVCERHIELLAITMQPYYLPEEFSKVIVVVVYISTSKIKSAREDLHSAVRELHTKDPGALLLITGDFNRVTRSLILPTFIQYINFPTRKKNILDLFYANVAEAYTASPLPPLGKSDHILLYLLPVNKSEVRRETEKKDGFKLRGQGGAEECATKTRDDQKEEEYTVSNCWKFKANF